MVNKGFENVFSDTEGVIDVGFPRRQPTMFMLLVLRTVRTRYSGLIKYSLPWVAPSAFQVRTELPFIEVANERHKYVGLVEYLLKHALSVYGAAIKPGQPEWPRASDVVVSLPSGISKSAEISVMDALNSMFQRVMPKVIGVTQVYYVSRADLRLFEDDTWRNIDTDFQASACDISSGLN